jgi:hypothetical protein
MRDFNFSVGQLVSAYLNNTLVHGNCLACAVGTLLKPRCASLGIPGNRWANAFVTIEGDQLVAKNEEIISWNFFTGYVAVNKDKAKDSTDTPVATIFDQVQALFDGSDYSKEEYARIEYAFETAPKGENDDDYMFNGLMAVVSVLAEIHGVDLEATEQARKLFVKA